MSKSTSKSFLFHPLLALAFGCIQSPMPILAADSQAQKPLAPPQSFNRKAWLQDYQSLKHQLEASYSHLAWFASAEAGVDLPALDRRIRRALDSAEGDADAKAAILGFIGGFHDLHLAQAPQLQAGPPSHAEPPQPDYEQLEAGDGLAALGNAPATAVAFSLPFESLKGSKLLSDGVSRPFRTAILTTPKGTRFGIIRIPRFREMDSPPSLGRAAWMAQKQTAMPIDIPALKEAISEGWLRALAEQLAQLRDLKLAAVLVDIGGNGGGNDTGDWAVRFFTTRDVHSARLYMAAAPAANSYFDEQLEGLQDAQKTHPPATPEAKAALRDAVFAFQRRKASVAARAGDMSWVWSEQRPWHPDGTSRLVAAGSFSGALDFFPVSAPGDRKAVESFYWAARVDGYRGSWTGPVYVLTDGKTASAAEMFAASMRDNGIARTVGLPTGGAGAGWMGAATPLELPHSHLRFQVPNCVRLRADGTDEVAGISPDLPVLPRQGESPRARAERVLETLESDLGVSTGRK